MEETPFLTFGKIFGNCCHKMNLIIIMKCVYAKLLCHYYIICMLYLYYNSLSIIVNSYCSSHSFFIIPGAQNDSI